MGYANTTRHKVKGPKDTLDKIHSLILSNPIDDEKGDYEGKEFFDAITSDKYGMSDTDTVIYGVKRTKRLLLFSIESSESSNFATELTEEFPDISVEWETFDEMVFYWECSAEQATSRGTEYGKIFES